MLPFFEKISPVVGEASILLKASDIDKFLAEHRRTLKTKLEKVSETFSDPQLDAPRVPGLISNAEASTLLLLNHLQDLTRAHDRALGYVEHMMYKQLEAAVGKVRQCTFHIKRVFFFYALCSI